MPRRLSSVSVRTPNHVCLLTHHHTAPPIRELVYAAIGLASVALYYKGVSTVLSTFMVHLTCCTGAGGGNAQREKINVLKAYTLVAMAYLAVATLAAFQYHVMWDDKDRYHHVYAEKLAPSLGLSKGMEACMVHVQPPTHHSPHQGWWTQPLSWRDQ